MAKYRRLTQVVPLLFSFALLYSEQVSAAPSANEEADIGAYFDALEEAGFIDIEGGSKTTLTKDVKRAEALLRSGSYNEAAILFYTIVESPRYEGFEDFIEYQNALYYLGVSLKRSGAYDASLGYLLKAMQAGPSSMYFGPAHRKAVDIALETGRPATILRHLEGLKLDQPVGPAISGERAYLRARIAYDKSQFDTAEAELVKITKKSRLYSSALYLRGVIRTRKGNFSDAANNFCEIAATGDQDTFTFVVDDRYFKIKDLARLGLARIAHETENYDNAYYHYFQIPEDSDKLGDALFEAAWSMYQKRELGTARSLTKDFLGQFPNSPLVPEARLLAGYIELADCKFEAAQGFYDTLVVDIDPIITEIEAIQNNSEKRKHLFDKALRRWREERAVPDEALNENLSSKRDRVLALLRFNQPFVQAHQAVVGMRTAVGSAPQVIETWRALQRKVGSTKVQSKQEEASVEAQEHADALALVTDIRKLRKQLHRSRLQLTHSIEDEILAPQIAKEEKLRLNQLEEEIQALEKRASRAANALQEFPAKQEENGILPRIQRDIRSAGQLEEEGLSLLARLETKADQLATQALDSLHQDTRRILDKAKLGKIDAVIGQKRRLEIEVQDLAAGRFPAELHGQLWEQGLIGDDEEFWPFEGEYWADEYEGWR